jgi:hypothetical protein
VIIEGANLHVRSGTGETVSVNDPPLGRGNLVIGYNEVPADEALLASDRDGEHNLIVGTGHLYPSNGGLVAGSQNAVLGLSSAVLGGRDNQVQGEETSVAGGLGTALTGPPGTWGGGSVEDDPVAGRFSVDAPFTVDIRARATADIQAATVDIVASATANVRGGIVQLNNGGTPAARLGDTVVGVPGSGVGTIVNGSATVLIGN